MPKETYGANIGQRTKGKFSRKNDSSDNKVTLTKPDLFDICKSYPEVLRETIPKPCKYEDLSEGIPPAQYTTHDSFSELEDISTLQVSASEP